MEANRWLSRYGISLALTLVCAASLTAYIDPYFHYRKPHTGRFFYALDNGAQRYINDGITRHFDYDALITGTSMTENFMASEFDEVFGCHSAKVPFSGGTYFEINSNQAAAFKSHEVKYMIRSLDYSHLADDKDALTRNFDYPFYLYNDSLLDDRHYLWNTRAILQSLRCLKSMFTGQRGITPFDAYSNWNASYTFGKEAVLNGRTAYSAPAAMQELSAEEAERVRGNVRQNVVALAAAHPETEFYYFFPPYSIASWGALYEEGGIEKRLEEERIAIELILECPNIHLFSFNTKFEWITNLDNYKDAGHYGEWLNAEMLRLMKSGECRITPENAGQYMQAEREFYTAFDYNGIF